MSIQTFTFSTQALNEADGFGAYHDLYSAGSDVAQAGEAFRARVQAYRFARMLVFDRRLDGLLHSRGPLRVRRDGFDHVTLHLLLSGSLVGGAPGEENHVAPGEIIVFDTTRPQWSRAMAAHLITVALARDLVEAGALRLPSFHGAVLPEAVGGLLADLVQSLARRASTLTPETANRAARAVAEFLAAALDGKALPVRNGDALEQLSLLRRRRAEAFIDERLADPRLGADAIAAGVGISRTVLYRAFAEDGGVGHFIQRRRLEALRNALRRLSETRSVAALAYAYGFTSESHCSRAFRAAYGQPPGQFRAEIHRVRADGSDAGGLKPILVSWQSELY
ncbi:hypothetical protein MPOCJGCO_1744 [Methylobacterium trifolii]|uniref:HTH araC/xylS-type domain-containing protein n=1 Tax=Methylobacterium trifolii TaxID=1003092 RepID=A0ABQ4U002_9HYPH|nr:hypothetical protein MPOCJGCO_1744 [Methylobacterium trifolii]